MGKINLLLGGHRRGDESARSHDSAGVFSCTHRDEYYVTINSRLCVVGISRYLILSYSLSYVHAYSTGEGVSLHFDEWAHLVALIPTIHERHPELSTGLV